MKIGYSTWGMPTVPVDTAISHIANLGFDGIELTIIPRFTTELSTLDAAERELSLIHISEPTRPY